VTSITPDCGCQISLPAAIAASRRQYAPGQFLLKEGEQGQFVEVILSGHVRLYVEGREIGVVSPGSAVGASAAFAGKPHAYSAVAAEDVITDSVSAAVFLDCLQHDPVLMHKVLDCVNHEAALALLAVKHIRRHATR
jgi:CRP-like cAMP-binding protein